MRVTFDISPSAEMEYSVIMARYGDKWVFARHRSRGTWEIPGGHIEPGENPRKAAERELWEETGASSFFLREIGSYGVIHEDSASYGVLFFAQVKGFDELPTGFEIAELVFSKSIPENLTYPQIQPLLFNRANDWLSENMTVVFFIRHAESDISVKDDAIRPLTEKGLSSAVSLANRLEDIRFDKLYSSPYKRAFDTVKPLADRNNLDITVMDGFKERRVDDVWLEDFHAFSRKQWEDFDYRLEGGESLRSVQSRNIEALNDILLSEKGKTVAIGTHGTALSTILNHYDPTFDFDAFERIRPIMPYIIRMEFIGENLIRSDEVNI